MKANLQKGGLIGHIVQTPKRMHILIIEDGELISTGQLQIESEITGGTGYMDK